MIPNDSLMIRKTAGVQRSVIDFTPNCPIYQAFGDCVQCRHVRGGGGIADILASVSCTGWRVSPPTPRLPSVSPSPPQSWLRPARLLLLQSMLCQLCVAPACNSCAMPSANNCKAECASSAGCTPQQAGRPLDTLRALHPPSDAPPAPPTQRRKDCEARQWCAA